MSIRKIIHLNLIGHEINESLNKDAPSSDREVFCKKLHKVTEPLAKDCENCEYFAGLMMGYGHACAWEDDYPSDAPDEKIVPHGERMSEMLRVSKLIDQNVIRKG